MTYSFFALLGKDPAGVIIPNSCWLHNLAGVNVEAIDYLCFFSGLNIGEKLYFLELRSC